MICSRYNITNNRWMEKEIFIWHSTLISFKSLIRMTYLFNCHSCTICTKCKRNLYLTHIFKYDLKRKDLIQNFCLRNVKRIKRKNNNNCPPVSIIWAFDVSPTLSPIISTQRIELRHFSFCWISPFLYPVVAVCAILFFTVSNEAKHSLLIFVVTFLNSLMLVAASWKWAEWHKSPRNNTHT